MSHYRTALITLSLSALLVTSSYAQKSAPEIKVSGSGKNIGACADDAERKAVEAAFRSVACQEDALDPSSLSCMMSEAKTAVHIKRRDPRKLGPDSCEVTFTITYDRPAVLKAGRTCRGTDVSVPVGIVLRGERAKPGESERTADVSLTQQAIGQISNGLSRARFQVVSLPQFQNDFLDLKMIIGRCALTGDPTAAEWTEGCKQRFDNYLAARDALSRKLSDAVADTPQLQGWKECGGLFLSGEVRFTSGARDTHGEIGVDYYVLADEVSRIEPHTDSRTVSIDLGGDDYAVGSALAQLTASVVADATQKLSKFAHSRGCEARRE